MGGTFTVDASGNGTDKFTDRGSQPLADGEVVNYSWSGNTKGAYLYILFTQNGSSNYAPQSVLDATATSGSGSFTFSSIVANASVGDYFQVGLQDTDYFTTATTKPSARSSSVQFTLSCSVSTPSVTSISPSSGPTSGGTTVVLTGTNFAGVSGSTGVTFGGANATGYTVNSATQITAVAPAGAGTVDVRVTNAGQTSATNAADQFTYVAAPVVTSISPTAGSSSGGTSVVVTGSRFSGTTAVTFGGTPASFFTVNSATQITATAPAGSGTVDLRVTTVGGTSATSAADQFTFVSAPTVTALSPTAGPSSGGTSVVITGTNLVGATAVVFGGTPATGFTVNSATQITATAPAGSGTVNVRVVTAGGTSATGVANQYSYAAAPTVTSISPTAGTTSGGTSVIVTGTNLAGATAVSFGGTNATSFTVNSSTQITASSPAHAAGTVNVTVTTLGGTSATSAANQFVYSVTPAAPVVSTPADGSTIGSSTPTYSGTSDPNVTVTVYVDGASIGTTSATGAGTWSKVQPTNLSAAPHTVRASATNSDGLVSTSSATNSFTIAPAPVASSFTYGSIVPYNVGGDPATTLSVAGQVTNSPTSYAVGSSVTANGGTVSIDNGGTVSYTPPVYFRGNDSFSYTATNAGGTSAPATVTVAVGNPTLAISLTGSGTRGTPLAGVQVTTSGGGAPYGCSTTLASGALPAGTTLNSDCTITGTPAASGTFNFTVSVTDSSVGTGPFTQTSAALSLSIAAPTLALSPAAGALPGATAGTPYSQTFTVSGGTGGYTYLHTGGALAPGLTLSSGGVLSGTPTASGTFNFQVTATDGSTAGSGGPYSVTNSYSITVNEAAPDVGPVSATVAYGSSNNPITLDVSGAPATAVAVDSPAAHGTATASGTSITYTPAAGYYGPDGFTYTATGPGGTSAPATVSITVATPAAPTAADKSGVAVPYGSSGTAIDLSSSIAGVHSSIAVASGPAHGTTSISGDVVTYTPATDYYGADSFTYTATGPGGTSAPATVSITVATPAAPTVSDKSGVAVPYDSSGTAIDLSSSIAGVHSSIAVASGPAHGTTSVAGDVVTYTPTAGYYGADSFTYTATGPGGTSAPATVSIAVATPAAPTAADKSDVAVPYGSSGTAIDLSSSVAGLHSSIAVATGPAHGTASVAGDVVTYTPAAGFYGADSFTYTATGPGGTSAPAPVTLAVAVPGAPTSSNATANVPYNSSGKAIDLSGSVAGVHTGIAIATAPSHGTASASGDIVTYTPATGYYGADSFTYTATGPGGTSAPATVSVTVALPPAPQAANATASVPYNSSGTTVDLTGSVTGVHSSIAVATAPAHGTATVAGDSVTYTPAAGYFGTDSFAYTATGPGGTSPPAIVSLTVAPPAPPTAAPVELTVRAGGPVSVDLTANASGGPFTAAAILSTMPAESGDARLIESGSEGNRSYKLEFTPRSTFSGAATILYTLSNAGGTSQPLRVTINVTARPDPAQDPEVRGLETSQTGAVRQFAQSQVQNFTRRLEQLHGGGGGGNSFAVSLSSGVPMRSANGSQNSTSTDDPTQIGHAAPMMAVLNGAREGQVSSFASGSGNAVLTRAGATYGAAANGAADASDTQAEPPALATEARASSVGLWANGTVTVGRRDPATGRPELSISTSGISGGADVRVASNAALGIGFGFGHDKTKVGGNGSQLTAGSWAAAGYGSFQPSSGTFIDFVGGVGGFDFDIDRFITEDGAMAAGNRNAHLVFGSVTTGIERQSDRLLWSLYGGLQGSRARLNAYAERGPSGYALVYDDRTLNSLSGTFGGRFRAEIAGDGITFLPRGHLEYSYNFEHAKGQRVRFGDWMDGPSYMIDADGWSRGTASAEIGLGLRTRGGWEFGGDLLGNLSGNSRSAGLRIEIRREF